MRDEAERHVSSSVTGTVDSDALAKEINDGIVYRKICECKKLEDHCLESGRPRIRKLALLKPKIDLITIADTKKVFSKLACLAHVMAIRCHYHWQACDCVSVI